jgi:predicted GNAT family N-acyltransferase
VYERFGFVKTAEPVTADGIVFVPMQYLPQSNS